MQGYSSDHHIKDRENELSWIKFNIIGISEMRRKVKSASHFMTAATIYSDNTAVSDTVAQLTIKINSKYHLNII